MEWRPIETAPREPFERILATGPSWHGAHNLTQIIFWSFTWHFREVSVGDGLYRKERVRLNEGWRRDGDSGEIHIQFEPTHWMPLPSPPPPK